MIPAALSLAFLLFSLYPVIVEGPFGFWTDLTQTYWGVQVWFDLLLAFGISCYFISLKAKEVGVSIAPWLALVLCTGCIGILAFLSRVLYVQEHSPAR